MDRAYSILNVKSVQEDQRIIRGIATTPTPDRVGDIVEPLGVKFKNPMPLLWQHNTDEPVGTVRFDKPTKAGIDFEAKLPTIDQPGTLKDRIDEAWQSIKLGLVRAVSIGFRAIEFSFMDDGGIRFQESEVLELSLVTIPANADATIQQIKSIDAPLLAASGIPATERPKPPGVSGKTKSVSLAPKDAQQMPTYTEQITVLESRRADAQKIMDEIQEKCSGEARSKTDQEREQFDTALSDIEVIDKELADVHALERVNRSRAVPVMKTETPEAAARVRNPYITMKATVPEGTVFTRMVIARALGHLDHRNPAEVAKSIPEWENTPDVALALQVDQRRLMQIKAAIGVGTTTDATWASPLIAFTQATDEFVALLRPLTIIGRIPGLNRVPFNVQIPRETASAQVGWVGEDAPKPVSRGTFDSIQLRWAKAAGIVVLSEELIRFSNPSAEAVIRNQLMAQMAQFLDRQFIDPAVAAVTNVSPASITNSVTPVTATGTTAAAFRADARTMWNTMLSNNQQLGPGVWIGTQQQAAGFATTLSSLGVPLFPGMTPQGGTLLGYPYIASENLPATGGSPADGYPLIFAMPQEILLADDGTTLIDVSREASVQMDSAPDSPPTAATSMYSFWQMNAVGIRAERWITWLKRRTTAVGFIQNAKYAE